MSEFNEDFITEADRFLVESQSMKLIMDFSQALKGFEDFRSKIKDITQNGKPTEAKAFVKAFSKVDKAMSEVEKLLKKL